MLWKQAPILIAGLIAFSLGGCATQPIGVPQPASLASPPSAKAALDLYYATIPDADLPVAPAGQALPSDDAVLSRILLASCNDEEKASPALAQVAEEAADLFIMMGDNVYGDRDGKSYVTNDPDLMELRQSFEELASRPEFQAVRAAHPIMAAWDDHDYGVNDGGGNFPFKGLAERVHERFWGLSDEDVGRREGTYYARAFGPAGQRVQVIMLDTRYFRSELTPSDEWGKTGKERYIPAPEGSGQEMLGAAQWRWLEDVLQQPADVRLIVSSVQVLPTAHGWESWNKLPAERARLFDLIGETGATGVVFVSGDRHSAFLYHSEDLLPYQAYELTASSLNVSFASQTSEMDARQLGAGFPPENFGAVEIDWAGRAVALQILNASGDVVRQKRLAFTDIGLE